jgi:predicted nucleic acid-binding protein
MIVADVNVIAYLLIDGPYTQSARAALSRDSHWISPTIWRHEFLNFMATSVREKRLTEGQAMVALANAPILVQDAEVEPPALEVLRLSVESRIATYDCIYVVVARRLGVHFVTADKKLVQEFPDITLSLEDFAAGK